MFDYHSWIERAVSFTEEVPRISVFFEEVHQKVYVKPSLTEDELNAIRAKTDKYIPKELTLFWLNGSRHCRCSYICRGAKAEMITRIESVFAHPETLYGGANFYDAADLPDNLHTLQEWAEETWIAEYPEQKSFWLNTIPFAGTENGDYLGLVVTDKRDDPPVIYLSHDDDSEIVAESFTEFLTAWENICYIGPEIWMLKIFRNENGVLDAKTNRAAKLRKIFGLD